MKNIPRDEMFLAKLIQNAGAYGLYSCRHALFRDRSRHSLNPSNYEGPILEHEKSAILDKAAFCCAFGAARLDPSTDCYLSFHDRLCMESGNDGSDRTDRDKANWFEVGQAFFDARKRDK